MRNNCLNSLLIGQCPHPLVSSLRSPSHLGSLLRQTFILLLNLSPDLLLPLLRHLEHHEAEFLVALLVSTGDLPVIVIWIIFELFPTVRTIMKCCHTAKL